MGVRGASGMSIFSGRILGHVRRQDVFSSFYTPYIGRGVWQGGRGTFKARCRHGRELRRFLKHTTIHGRFGRLTPLT